MTRIYSFQKPASLPGRAPRDEEAPARAGSAAATPLAPAPQQNRPDPGSQPHHMKGAGFWSGLCAEQRPQRSITGYLRCSGFLPEPRCSPEASHKINTCLLCYEETGDTAHRNVTCSRCLLSSHLSASLCFVFVRGYIQTRSLTAIALLNCKVFF